MWLRLSIVEIMVDNEYFSEAWACVIDIGSLH